LKEATKLWNYYATLALAGLPDGVGIPALIELVRDPSVTTLGSGDFALRPLAQAAVQYPEAARALIEQARANQIPDAAWPTVIASLAGTYIQYGNQWFGSTAPPANGSDAEITQRIALIDQLLAVTANSAARTSLQTTRASLAGKLSR